jgi:hypothetical protein
MARAMARQAFQADAVMRGTSENLREYEDSWPDEPTQVDAALTMEELILDELRRSAGGGRPANDPKKETHPH